MERVLFVDESETLRGAVRAELGAGLAVHVAAGAEEALALLAERSFAAIVADHDLPGRSGTELLEEVRRTWPETVRVLTTGAPRFELAVEALERGGVFRILPKPFELGRLAEAVRAAVERFELRSVELRLTEELRFTRETLLEFTVDLEERLRVRNEQLRGLDLLSTALNNACSLEEVGQRATVGLSRLLAGRGVRLELRAFVCAGSGLCWEAGPALRGEAASVPLRTADGEVGRVFVARRHAGTELSGEDRRVVETVACATAVAVHNELRRRQRDEAQHTTVFALARLAEERDNETGMHMERVAEYCRILARGLREDGLFLGEITDQFVEDIVRSSPLHDIGKVGIPDNVLLKPEGLTPEEWLTMKQHTTIGAGTLRSIIEQTDEPPSFLEMGMLIAWCHHEHWDGSGYPRSLRGELIPLAARILTVADCYDALTTRRPYKEPWTHEQAVGFFLDKKGAQFDPRIVDALVKRERLLDEVRTRLADPQLETATP